MNPKRPNFSSNADYAHWGEEAAIVREAEERHAPEPEYYYNPEEGE